jgi:hypothetical protein
MGSIPQGAHVGQGCYEIAQKSSKIVALGAPLFSIARKVPHQLKLFSEDVLCNEDSCVRVGSESLCQINANVEAAIGAAAQIDRPGKAFFWMARWIEAISKYLFL